MTPASDPPVQHAASAASGAGLLRWGLPALAFLAACLPLLQTARFPPLAGFWHEAAAAALYLACATWALLSPQPAGRGARLPFTVFGAAATWFSAVVIVQAAAGMTRYATEALVAAAIVALAVFVHLGGLAERHRAAVHLRAWAIGIVAALVLNAAAVVLRFCGWEIIGVEVVPASDFPRPIGLIGQSNHLGVLGVLGMVCAVYLRAASGLARPVFWALIVLGSMVCAVSASRAALLVALGTGAALLFCLRDRRRHALPLLCGLVVFLAVQAAWAAWTLSSGSGPSTSGTTSALRVETSGRIDMLRDAWLIFLSHPVFGVGWGNYAAARLFELSGSLPSAHATHAHNFFAQVLAEYGLVGGGPLAVAALAVPFIAMRRARGEGTAEAMLVVGVVVGMFVFGLVEHPMWFTYFLLAVAWLLGLGTAGGLQPNWQNLGLRPPTRPMVAVLAVGFALLLFAVARDYTRIQAVATRLYNAIGMNRPDRMPTADERLAALKGNLLPRVPEILLLRTLPVDTMFVKDKLEMAERAARSAPAPETVIHYTIFLTLAKGHQEGHRFLEPLRTRSAKLYDPTVRALARVAPLDPELARLARLHGLDVPVPTPPEPPAGTSPRR